MLTSPDQLAELFSAGRYHDLIAAAQAAEVTPQSDPPAAQLLAGALFSVGQFADAAPLLDQLEPAFGLNPEFLSLFGANCRRLGQLQRAEELFARALAISPHSVPIRNNQANLLIDLGRFDEAREILTRLLEEVPDYGDARANLNRLSFQNNQENQGDPVMINLQNLFRDGPWPILCCWPFQRRRLLNQGCGSQPSPTRPLRRCWNRCLIPILERWPSNNSSRPIRRWKNSNLPLRCNSAAR